ncbi:Nucleolar GTP-binding protein 1 [Coemansia sp. RSA 2671]|uniref:Nucleolar GTP-binding protein 1 n=1 Tax=Coemansia linderi TaxID=2663919 RepID=A0ACC1KH97_9FUNG|nr:Nucleolar GTP-binding protein 1 [Coemansia sp. RSA 2675]KAJ2025063.1 Nucleolar GTP-binding protein 1 [Coemansia sp. S85]KAJ2348775.1 Nucleolar GTP-binding protein 1 [Coemansia sp. RSA 2671]KAJ2697480.1 Nucleolar GTP-binding protein 1 [Coemansia sp. IMI 209128]KAJ2789830.1 Nucleolar GTP-binding protein 1 [Coemansia linderi]
MTSIYNFKRIAPVPESTDFLDIVLSKTQRKTPTVIHPGYKITRIRQFYMRKVKFTQETFDEKLRQILEEFPVLDNVHPFYADLMNVLYDKDHYKLALGQINTAKHLIDAVGKDYLRLLKFGDSLYRCKQLKRAALGRMATIMKRQKDSLSYLEQVRQHLARLPSIDPNTRTLIVCGYPNVGKSSFMNKVTRADVDVQPYAFTTKSLFVGHMDYKYLRWQVIDTPGILDHPLEERNTIEMQSITALAHLRAAVLFFVDLSEQCGYSIQDQMSLFASIKPLFANKPTLLVISKTDVCTLDAVRPEERQLVESACDSNVEMSQLSSYLDTGVIETRNLACDKLLLQRVEMKLKGNKVNSVLNKLNVAQPGRRDTVERPACIPTAVLERRSRQDAAMADGDDRPVLERDLEATNGGAGVYNIDLKKRYLLASDEWRHDVIPEIMNGKNVADFIDPDIEEKLAELEREEERLAAEGLYDSAEESEDEEERRIRDVARRIRQRKQVIANESRVKDVNRATLTNKQKAAASAPEDFVNHLQQLGLDPEAAASTAQRIGRKRGRSESRDPAVLLARSSSLAARAVSTQRDRSTMGLKNARQKTVSDKKKLVSQRQMNLMARAGESDRKIGMKMPKHLVTGKRSIGTNDRR